MDHVIEAGDKVKALVDIGHIEAGDKFRVFRVAAEGVLELTGEVGVWSAENFALHSKGGSTPAAFFPSPADQPEAASVTISIDHVMKSAALRGEAFANLQFSSNDAHHVLLNQVEYFSKKGEGVNIMVDPRHVAAVASGFGQKVFYAYTPSARLTNLIMDADVFGYYCDTAGSVMGGVAAAVQEADVMHENWSRGGSDTTLMVFVPAIPSDEIVAAADTGEALAEFA